MQKNFFSPYQMHTKGCSVFLEFPLSNHYTEKLRGEQFLTLIFLRQISISNIRVQITRNYFPNEQRIKGK
jgi:hypothetical protein